MALNLFLKHSHLDGNWKTNAKFPGPFLQTQVHSRARSSRGFSETAVCEGPVICPRTQFKDA